MKKPAVILLLIASFVCLPFTVWAADKEWTAEEKLAKLNKPAVVRIYSFYWAPWTIGNVQINTYYGGHGSGAIINPDGYVVTNAHVVEAYTHDDKKKRNNLAWDLVRILTTKYNLTRNQAIQLINSQVARIGPVQAVNVVITPGGDQLPFDLKEIGSPAGNKDGKDVAIIKIEGRNLPTVRLGDSDKIRTGERIFVAGYPADADLGAWGAKKSHQEWSWAPGTISSDKKTSAQGTPLIQVNAEGIKPGNSGGPVLNADGEVIGLLTFGTPGGPHWAMASRTIQEFVRKAGTVNERGITDTAYKQGLEYYWQGYYSKALSKFEEVKRLYAKHSETEGLIADCQHKIAQKLDRTYWPDYYLYLGIVAVILAGVSIFLLLRRQQLKTSSAKTAGANAQKPDQETMPE
ncbi:MAG: serine protease [Negativicutes bacterium]|nr:serine protease [Negativicutes bacterium]